MDQSDSRCMLDDILCEWHYWAAEYRHVAGVGGSAMFRHTKSPRGYESEGDIADATIHNARMEAVNFHVFELQPDWRTAIQINARNLATGKSVWSSPRLPADVEARSVLVREARNALLDRLIRAGVA